MKRYNPFKDIQDTHVLLWWGYLGKSYNNVA